MQEVAEYRRYADVCRKLTRELSDPESKRQLVEMATVWTFLADERERLLQNDHPGRSDQDAPGSFAPER